MDNYIKSVMIGHAVGDALGVLVEQRNLDRLKSGSLNYAEIMANFDKWYYMDDYTATGELFDVGNTCSIAIENYVERKMDIYSCGLKGENANGNGSLMRIHPFVLYAESNGLDSIEPSFKALFSESSSLTHAQMRLIIGSETYAFVLSSIINKPQEQSILDGLKKAKEGYYGEGKLTFYHRLFMPNFYKLSKSDIKSIGYVVDTLEASLWCLLATNSYKECVLKAVNLSGDIDTVGAIVGGIALHCMGTIQFRMNGKIG